MDTDSRQDRRDQRLHKERFRMVVHKVKSPRSGERLVKLITRGARKAQQRTTKRKSGR